MNITPLLPTEKIKKCLIGGKYLEEIADLTAIDIECIHVPSDIALEKEIAFHADINIFNCGNSELIVNDSIAGDINGVSAYSIIKCSGIKSPYPDDVKLNCVFLGNRVIGNSKYIAPEIKSFCDKNDIEFIHTNQGYAKCSLGIVNYNAVITEDETLAYLLKKYQIDVLKIQKGFVSLSESHYGFIGGACGKISHNEMYFSGDLSKHPDYKNICNFLDKYNIKPVYNKNRPLNDFGGFIPI